jgi:hypothetical protein
VDLDHRLSVPANTIDLEFADGEYTFTLGLEQIEELQRKCSIGIGGLFARVLKGCVKEPITGTIYVNPSAGEFFAVDIIETLRQGLIGGGKGVVDGVETKVTHILANNLIKTYVLARPLADSWSLAAAVLGACVVGYDPPKKDEPAEERAPQTAEKTDA